ALEQVGAIAAHPDGAAAIPILRHALSDEDAGIRARAQALLSKHGPKAPPEPDEDDDSGRPAGQSAGAGGGASPLGAAPPALMMPGDLAGPEPATPAPVRRHSPPPDMARPPDLVSPWAVTEEARRQAAIACGSGDGALA